MAKKQVKKKSARVLAMTRLAREGRGEDFEAFRKRFVAVGVKPEHCWKVALFAYAPLNGSALEIVGDPSFEEWAKDWRSGVYKSLGEPPGQYRFAFPDVEFDEAATVIADTVNKSEERKSNNYKQLELAVPAHKKATNKEIMEWVFENVRIPVAQIDPASVPCRGATLFLEVAKKDPNRFLDRWFKEQSGKDGREELSDDGREQLTRIEEYEDFLFAEEMAETAKQLEELADDEPEQPEQPQRPGGPETWKYWVDREPAAATRVGDDGGDQTNDSAQETPESSEA